MRFVAVKSTAQSNQARGLLAEHGIVIARGFAQLRRALPLFLEDFDNGLSAVMRELLGEIGERPRFIDDRLRQYDITIQRLFRQDERCQRVAAVEGVGPVTATALVAAVGNATDFRSGRELAAYLGLVPRHRASGVRTVLLIPCPFSYMDRSQAQDC